MNVNAACPNCGNDLWREEADVGVGIIYGPYHCDDHDCGYSEESFELVEPDGRVPRDLVPKADEWHKMVDEATLDELMSDEAMWTRFTRQWAINFVWWRPATILAR